MLGVSASQCRVLALGPTPAPALFPRWCVLGIVLSHVGH